MHVLIPHESYRHDRHDRPQQHMNRRTRRIERGTMSRASRPSLALESEEIVDDVGVVVFEPTNPPIELATTVVVVMVPETVELDWVDDWVDDCVEARLVVPWVVPMNLTNKKKN